MTMSDDEKSESEESSGLNVTKRVEDAAEEGGLMQIIAVVALALFVVLMGRGSSGSGGPGGV
jgi:hypothetical protein